MNASRWTSERVAVRVIHAIDRDRRYVVVGRTASSLWWLKRLAPRGTTALIAAIYKRLGNVASSKSSDVERPGRRKLDER